MTQHRIVSHSELRSEMMAVAREQQDAPADAGGQSFESVEALMGLRTSINKRLLTMICDRKP